MLDSTQVPRVYFAAKVLLNTLSNMSVGYTTKVVIDRPTDEIYLYKRESLESASIQPGSTSHSLRRVPSSNRYERYYRNCAQQLQQLRSVADLTSFRIQIPLNIVVFKSLKEKLSSQRTTKTPTLASCTMMSRYQTVLLITIGLLVSSIGRWLDSLAGKLQRVFILRYELQSVRISLHLICQRRC